MSLYNWPHPGCVGLWHFEDNGNDSSGQGNNGSPTADVAYTLGKFLKCSYLTADYYTLSYAAALKVSNLTISMWYKSTSADAVSALFACSGIYIGPSGYTYYGYRFDTRSGKATLMVMGTSIIGNTSINDGKWHFLMGTRNDSVARVYVDGRLDAATNSPPGLSYNAHNPATYQYAGAYIGAAYRPMTAPSTIGYFPTGYIDELMIENYSIEPKEAMDRYLFQRGLLS
jgi:hypothetical protein